jgi:antitoxin MazE
MKARVIRIGNSRGIRIPQKLLARYRIKEGATLELEEKREGIMLRPMGSGTAKAGWAEAYRELAADAAEAAEWGEWDAIAGDGIDG